jgi:transcriptional regulator with XRE-family HTH domain
MSTTNNYQPGELFKILRSLKGIKQEQAAKTLGIRQQAVSKLEQCKNISTQRFEAIITAFSFSEEEIEMAKKFLPPPSGK